MNLKDVLNLATIRLLLLVVLYMALAFAAAFLVERALTGALKGLKMALKAEFTTDGGRMNFVSVFLITFLTIFLKLHEMEAEGLKTEHPTGTGEPVSGFLLVIGLPFLC